MKNSAKLGLLALTMLNVAAIASVRSLPMMTRFGLSSIVYFLLVAGIFFIPAALVSAELATGWPKQGGVFVWVTEAMGPRLGFLAIWLQWTQNLIWYPTVLAFGAATIAYAYSPELADNKVYTLLVVLAAYWLATLSNLFGMKAAGFISGLSVVLGTIFPFLLITGFGVWWLIAGDPSQIPLHEKDLIPHPHGLNTIVLAAGVLVTFVGIEMTASHASDARNPQRDYPRAIFIAAFIILTIYILGTLVVGVVLPSGELNIVSGLVAAFKLYMKAYGIEQYLPVVAFLMAVGVFGQVNSWVAGPSKGLLAVANKGYLPKIFRHVNEHGVQVNILLLQGAIVTILPFTFLLLPSISSAYWMLSILAAEIYLTMYVLMFASGIILRYTHPKTKRPYRVPGKNLGMWCIAGLGFCGSVAAIIITSDPPAQFTTLSPVGYRLFLGGGLVLLSIPPFILYALRKRFS